MNIMVTGAAGEYGTYALGFLKQFAPDAHIITQVRDQKKAAALEKQGFEVRVADYADADGMMRIMEGVDRLLFISSPVQGVQKNVVDAAKENGVKYLAYTSIYDPEQSKFGLEINHRQTEKWIMESGVPYTILRDNWYTEVNQGVIQSAAKTGRFVHAAGDGLISTALKREYAEVGARVIAEGGYLEIINLAGKPYTYKELGEAVAAATGKPVEILEGTMADSVAAMVSAGVSEQWAKVTALYQDYTRKGDNGEAQADPTEFETVLGKPLTSLAEAVKEIIKP